MAVGSDREELQAHLGEAVEILRRGGAWDDRHVSDWLNPEFLLSRIVSGWRFPLGGVLVAVVLAVVYLMLIPRSYVAEAFVAPTRSYTDVQFEPKIKTVSGDQRGPTVSPLTPERRQALADLVTSPQLEDTVSKQLAGKVAAAELAPGQLVSRITGRLKSKSELITIQATAPNPSDALSIVNAWAASYVIHTNAVYATGSSDLETISQQRDDAQKQYAADQDALSAKLKDNKSGELDRQIQDRVHRILVLQSSYQAGTFASTGSGGAGGSGSTDKSDKPTAAGDPQAARDDYRLAELRTLNDLAQVIRRLDDVKQQAQSLLMTASGDAASDGLALALLKTQLVTVEGGLPSQLQFQVSSAAGSNTRIDLQALVDNISQARAKVATEFESRRAAYEKHRTADIGQLEQEVRTLRAEKETADAELNQLTLKRDVSWSSYSALSNKVQELQIYRATNDREVELASVATYALPTSRRLPQTLAIAAVVGLLVGAGVALVYRREPAKRAL